MLYIIYYILYEAYTYIYHISYIIAFGGVGWFGRVKHHTQACHGSGKDPPRPCCRSGRPGAGQFCHPTFCTIGLDNSYISNYFQ